MQELAIHHLHEAPSPGSSSSMPTPIDKRIHHLAINATLRKQFVYYTMLGDVTNVESMTRTSFGKFVWHCNLHEVATPPLTDPDIGGIFARANGVSLLMTFEQWLVACELIFSLIQATSSHLDSFESFMKTHVLPKAQIIKCQNIAPDVSQLHVLKLLRESLWPLRQLFCHFTEQSLLDVASIATMDMKRFLCFARSFSKSIVACSMITVSPNGAAVPRYRTSFSRARWRTVLTTASQREHRDPAHQPHGMSTSIHVWMA